MGKPSPKYRKYCSRHTTRSRTGGRHLRKMEYADWKQKNARPSGKMKQFLADNEERIDYRYFPVGWPQLNPMEGFWNILKQDSFMHEHYDSVDERVGRALYFLQNSRISIDCETYIFRDPKPIANLF